MDGYPRTAGRRPHAFDEVLRQQFLDLDRGGAAAGRRRGDRAAAERPLELSQAAARRPTTRVSNPPRVAGDLRRVRHAAGAARRRQGRDGARPAGGLSPQHGGADSVLPAARDCCARSPARGRSSRCTQNIDDRSLKATGRPAVFKSLFSARSPELKSPREIGLMREAGKIVAEALRLCRAMAKPGVAHHRDRPGGRGPVRRARRHAAVQGLPRPRCRSRPSPASRSTSRWSTASPASGSSATATWSRSTPPASSTAGAPTPPSRLSVGDVQPGEAAAGRRWREQVLRIAMRRDGPAASWWSEVAAQMQQHAERPASAW